MSKQEDYNWTRFFDATKDLPPRDTLLRALSLFEADWQASQCLDVVKNVPLGIDLGCGDGRDAKEMLRRGWRVLAIDSSSDAIHALMNHVDASCMTRLEARVQRFEDAVLPPATLVNASFSIPHCDPRDFPALWANATRAIKPEGRFSGQLFGVNDEWARKPDGVTRTYHTREQVESLLACAGLVPEFFDEVERPGKNAFGEPKHWHVFHIVARRRA